MAVFIFYLSHLSILILVSTGGCNIINPPKDTNAVVGQTVRINCKTSESYSINWDHIPVGSKAAREIYLSRTIVTPYNRRFSVVGDQNKGEYDLLISSVQLEDAGKLWCTDKAGHGERKEVELVVLVSAPQCQSNIDPDGVIGNNDCAIEPDDLEFSCNVRYSGNIPPVLVWKKAGNDIIKPKMVTIDRLPGQVMYTAVFTANLQMNGLSYIFQINQSKLSWTSDVVNVLYAFNTVSASNITQTNLETCLANSSSSQSCLYTWVRISPTTGISETLAIGRAFYPEISGKYICVANCSLRHHICTVQSKVVEFIEEVTWSRAVSGFGGKIWIVICIVLLVVITTLTLVWIFRKRLSKIKKKSYYHHLDTKTYERDLLVQGMAILNGRIYVIRRGFNKLSIYQMENPGKTPEQINVPKMSDPKDIVSCTVTNRLYITDAVRRCIFKMSAKGKFTIWMEDIQRPFTISVNSKGQVLLPQRPNTINICDSDKSPWKVITIAAHVHDMQHAVEILEDEYIVSFGENFDKKHEVLKVGRDGNTIRRFDGNQQLRHPRHVAIGDGKVFVADKGNNRVLVLDHSLNLKEIITSDIQQPTRLLYRDKFLIIGQYKSIRVYSVKIPEEGLKFLHSLSFFNEDKDDTVSDEISTILLSDSEGNKSQSAFEMSIPRSSSSSPDSICSANETTPLTMEMLPTSVSAV